MVLLIFMLLGRVPLSQSPSSFPIIPLQSTHHYLPPLPVIHQHFCSTPSPTPTRSITLACPPSIPPHDPPHTTYVSCEVKGWEEDMLPPLPISLQIAGSCTPHTGHVFLIWLFWLFRVCFSFFASCLWDSWAGREWEEWN